MSNGQVLSFLRRSSSCDWTQQELAEFYRVEDVLLQGGFAVATDRGVSDEGDPWFVVCRADTEEVIAHFARIDREYVIVSNLYPGAARGSDFRTLVREMLEFAPTDAADPPQSRTERSSSPSDIARRVSCFGLYRFDRKGSAG